MTGSPVDDIGAIVDGAQDAPDLREPDRRSRGDSMEMVELPPDCPVQPLGHLSDKLYFLDYRGQLRTMGSEFRKGELMLLFGTEMLWLDDSFPQWKNIGGNSDKNPPQMVKDGFNQTKVQRALIHESARRGLFDPAGKVRGRGSHRGANGEIILHCGDAILIGGRKNARGQAAKTIWSDPGLIGPHIFPTAPGLPRPGKGAEVDAGRGVLRILAGWNWKDGRTVSLDANGKDRVSLDALLVLGWLGCAKLCGAIGWRPHMWLVGPSGAGKSTLQGLISRLLVEWALESQDPSEAWISQSLMDQRLPVLYDEPEPSEDGGGFVKKIIALARLASSGAKKGRGSSDHKAVDFVAYSCFLFSSIMHHELEQQDRNRMAILTLSKFPPNTAAIDVGGIEAIMEKKWGLKGTLNDVGLALTRRLVDQWPRYPATLAAYQAELLRHRVDPRGQNTYGEILALADLMLFDSAPIVQLDMGDPNEPDPEATTRCRRFVEALGPMLSIAEAEAESTSERCLGRLTQFRLSAAAGKHQETVARWIERAFIEICKEGQGGREARDKLRTHGMQLMYATRKVEKAADGGETVKWGAIAALRDNAEEVMYLAVANKNSEALRQIFAGTTWKNGEWPQALRMIEGSVPGNVKVRYDGPGIWSTLVPLSEIVDLTAARAGATAELAQLDAR
jgi:Predicted ATPase